MFETFIGWYIPLIDRYMNEQYVYASFVLWIGFCALFLLIYIDDFKYSRTSPSYTDSFFVILGCLVAALFAAALFPMLLPLITVSLIFLLVGRILLSLSKLLT